MRVERLRKKYSKFIYEKYSYQILKNDLEIFFNFKIDPDIYFKPKIIIENVNRSQIKRVGDRVLNNLVFHLGLIEIPSYWKAACSPEIVIKAGSLSWEQIKWWKDLIFKGMGQFFYDNKIDFQKSNFLKIRNFQRSDPAKIYQNLTPVNLKNRVLVPIGGGKDSIVTLEKLKERGKKIGCFLVNPSKAMREVVKVAKIKEVVFVKRKIDPNLLELNKKGFLNGHTPITAVYSFLSLLVSVLFNYRNIAFSNEKSADEGNVRYLGRMINHQWSKSSEFEKKFRDYCQKYLIKGINYFSFLRKYNTLEIAKMFTRYPQYFPVFSSCNVVLAKKLKKRWCGNCPKCLFIYTTLYPFLERRQLLKIFGTDIFENSIRPRLLREKVGASGSGKKLIATMKSLIDPKIPKPFECVGTKKENLIAFYLSWKKSLTLGLKSFILKYFEKKILPKYPQLEKEASLTKL